MEEGKQVKDKLKIHEVDKFQDAIKEQKQIKILYQNHTLLLNNEKEEKQKCGLILRKLYREEK